MKTSGYLAIKLLAKEGRFRTSEVTDAARLVDAALATLSPSLGCVKDIVTSGIEFLEKLEPPIQFNHIMLQLIGDTLWIELLDKEAGEGEFKEHTVRIIPYYKKKRIREVRIMVDLE